MRFMNFSLGKNKRWLFEIARALAGNDFPEKTGTAPIASPLFNDVQDLLLPFGRNFIHIYASLDYKIESVAFIPVKKDYLALVELFINRYFFDLFEVVFRQPTEKLAF